MFEVTMPVRQAFQPTQNLFGHKVESSMTEWLLENVGEMTTADYPPERHLAYIPPDLFKYKEEGQWYCYVKPDLETAVFNFREGDHATLFKLTWMGFGYGQ